MKFENIRLHLQVNQTITDVQTRAQSVSNDVHACIRQNITALEEKEKDLLAQVRKYWQSLTRKRPVGWSRFCLFRGWSTGMTLSQMTHCYA